MLSMAEIEEVEMGGETATERATQDDRLSDFVQQKLDAVPGEPLKLRPITIFRVPAWFHEADKFYYEPKIVSIGPYHHGKDKYRAMEEYKWSILRDFLSRNNKVNFNTYLREISALESQARECYSESVSMTSDEFVMMLSLDGCFIIEYFFKLQHAQPDPILFGATWSFTGIPSDMLLLENQIPFFIIHRLFTIHVGCDEYCKGPCPLLKLICTYLLIFIYKQKMGPPQEPCHSIQHLLHLCHTSMVPKLQIEKSNLVHNQSCCHSGIRIFSRLKTRFISRLIVRAKEKDEEGGEKAEGEEPEKEESSHRTSIMPCVSELHGVGVKFRRKKNPRHIFDISFENGIMEIPSIVIESTKKIIFTNVVAFEQSQHIRLSQTFSSYLALMDALVNTEKDVALLQKCGILENLLQNEEDAAMFFNHFGDFNSLDYNNHYFRSLFIKLRIYSNLSRHKYRAKLMHDYFNNPWSIISVVAGGLLLIFTGIQTYYTVYSSYHK